MALASMKESIVQIAATGAAVLAGLVSRLFLALRASSALLTHA